MLPDRGDDEGAVVKGVVPAVGDHLAAVLRPGDAWLGVAEHLAVEEGILTWLNDDLLRGRLNPQRN